MVGMYTFIYNSPKTLEYGLGVIYGGFPSSSCLEIRGRPYSNFLASTVYICICINSVFGTLPGRKRICRLLASGAFCRGPFFCILLGSRWHQE